MRQFYANFVMNLYFLCKIIINFALEIMCSQGLTVLDYIAKHYRVLREMFKTLRVFAWSFCEPKI